MAEQHWPLRTRQTSNKYIRKAIAAQQAHHVKVETRVARGDVEAIELMKNSLSRVVPLLEEWAK